jgi:molecular chaperone DnaK (HSP70)
VLYAHAHIVLKDHFTEAFMNEVTIKFVITVPANWEEREKHLALKAAKMAGLSGQGNELIMITEPEAAAMIAVSESVADEGHATSFQV